MNIIQRNFLRLLRAGCFASDETVEPMSAWKWRQAAAMAKAHGVEALWNDGAERLAGQFFLRLPDDVATTLRQASEQAERANAAHAAAAAALMRELSANHFRPMLRGGAAIASLYDNPLHRRVDSAVRVFFPFSTQSRKADKWAKAQCATHSIGGHRIAYEWSTGHATVEHHHRLATLSNKVLNHTLQAIIEHDLPASPSSYTPLDFAGGRLSQPTTATQPAAPYPTVETVPPTLMLLSLLIDVAHALIDGRLRLWLLCDVGIFLRKAGDKVDFVRLQECIEALHMQRMAQLTAALLVTQLAFTPDELPFVAEESLTSRNGGITLRELLSAEEPTDGSNDTATDEATLVLQAQPALSPKAKAFTDWLLPDGMLNAPGGRRLPSLRMLRQYPGEGFAGLLSSLIRSLKSVEE